MAGTASGFQTRGQFSGRLKGVCESKVIDFLMEKTISVEAAAEGPRVKPKRQLTEAQLAALKKGRERLAAKRQEAKEELPSDAAIAAAAAASVEPQPQPEPQSQPQPEPELDAQAQSHQQDEQQESDEDYPYSGPCVIM